MSKPLPPELDEALQQLEIQALSFGTRFVNDSRVRQDYIHKTQQMSRELRAAYEAGSMSAREAAETANQLRNEIMELARVRSSDLGRAKAQSLKAKGLDLDDLVAKYAKKMFDKDFAALTKGEQDRVLLEIVDSAGRANPKVSLRAARMGALGRGLWVLTAVVAIYNIGTAEDKVHASGREAANLGGGMAGSAAAGALAGIWFGPVGVAVGAVIGGVLGAVVADSAYIEITGPREESVRRFLPRFTSFLGGVDEAGIAEALVVDYGIDMDSVLAVFRELDNSYSSDADDVAVLYLAKVKDRKGSLEHALRLHPGLRNLLVLLLDGGWTTGEEYALMDYVRRL
jgi:hypothetical protein